MKTIKTTKKLHLNKHIISEMNPEKMAAIKGGKITDNLCNTITKAYFCTYSLNMICM